MAGGFLEEQLVTYSFLHGRSCLTNLRNASEQWTRDLDKKAGADVIYFDFKKAFDCVPHLRMLHKFNELGTPTLFDK